MLEIYRRLSTAASLLPTAVGFTFDRETRTAQAQQDLRDLAPGLVHFLPRRMFENYLILPAGIAASLARDDSEHAAADRLWSDGVDGARLLAEMFSELTEARVQYDKVRHGLEVVDWAIAAGDDTLRMLTVDWLERTVLAGV